MKMWKRQTLRFTIFVVLLGGCWIVTPIGCVGTQPLAISQQSTDQIILRAEQTSQTARLTFDTFVHLERENEAVLKQVNPQIHVYANTIREHGLDWVSSLRTATKTFKANRTAENQANLNTWIMTLTTAVTQTNQYIAAANKATKP